MGRRAVKVDKQKLQSAVALVESSGPKKNRSELFDAVVKEYNNSNPPEPLKAPVARSRILEWGFVLKTPKGKRGRQPGSGPVSRNRVSRGEKFKNSKTAQEAFRALRKTTEEKFLPIVDKIEAGSMKEAVRLKCIDCSGGSVSEVRKCQVKDCPLYNFRPYK